MKRSNKLFIEDIIESIDKIEDYIKDMSYEEFIDEQMVIDAVIRNLEVIGEAAKNLSDDIKNKYKNIPWKRIIGVICTRFSKESMTRNLNVKRNNHKERNR